MQFIQALAKGVVDYYTTPYVKDTKNLSLDSSAISPEIQRLKDISENWDLMGEDQSISLAEKSPAVKVLSNVTNLTQAILPEWGEKLSPEREAAMQVILRTFFDDPENRGIRDLYEIAEQINEHYPEYSIDLQGDVIDQVGQVVGSMIEKGEEKFLKGVGLYAAYSLQGVETTAKIMLYRENRSLVMTDIDYQRTMMNWYRYFSK